MKLALELTDEEGERLRQRAAAAGKPLDKFLKDLIAQLPVERPPTAQGEAPGAQLLRELRVDHALGIWRDRSDGPELARELRHHTERRVRSR
ncbi:MAG TPA: hypothetical protein VGN26_20625 [Armatimonadota bacterium]